MSEPHVPLIDGRTFPRPQVGGLRTIACTRADLAQLMLADSLRARELGKTAKPKAVFSSNGQGIALAGRDHEFASAMECADVIHADGMPVVKASHLTSTPLPERIATTDFFHDAAAVAEANGLRFFMLGASEDQNKRAVDSIIKMYPNLVVVGRHHGYFDEAEDERVCELIRASEPDVVWVALGKPRQEHWCIRNRERLAGVAWLKTCGGLYSFLTGDADRAPSWMQRSGLEWLFRAIRDPRRLGWRYLTTNPYAAYRLLRYTPRRQA